jgi:hypothetical protein
LTDRLLDIFSDDAEDRVPTKPTSTKLEKSVSVETRKSIYNESVLVKLCY